MKQEKRTVHVIISHVSGAILDASCTKRMVWISCRVQQSLVNGIKERKQEIIYKKLVRPPIRYTNQRPQDSETLI